jgi:hypothetical protein
MGIINLVIVDFVVCLVVSPLQIMREINNIFQPHTFLKFSACSFIKAFSTGTGFASVFGVTLISLERFLVFRNNRHLDRNRFMCFSLSFHMLAIIISCFNFGFIYTSHQPFDMLPCSTKCVYPNKRFVNWRNSSAVLGAELAFHITFTFIGYSCILVTTYCYYVIYQIIRTKQFIRLRLNGLITIKNTNASSVVHFTNTNKESKNVVSFKEVVNNHRCSLPKELSPIKNMSRSHASLEHSKVNKIERRPKIDVRFSFSDSHLNSPTVQDKCDISLLKKEKQMTSKNDDSGFKNLHLSAYNLDKVVMETPGLAGGEEAKVTIISLKSNNMLRVNGGESPTSHASCLNVSSLRSMPQINQAGTISMESKAIKKTIIPIVVFYIFLLPFLITKILHFYFESSEIIKVGYRVSTVVVLCHSSFNPIVYCITNVELRQAMLVKLKKVAANSSVISFLMRIFKK